MFVKKIGLKLKNNLLLVMILLKLQRNYLKIKISLLIKYRAKTSVIVNSDLEALAPSKYAYIYGDEDQQLSLSDCDDTFLGRMNFGSIGELNDEDTMKYLKDMKDEIERVGTVVV